MADDNQPEEVKKLDADKPEMRTSTKWAIGVTVIWLGGVAAYVFCNWCKFLKMDPNAIGDFLAGTMSPLALFWLVAGYRQQGEELRLNTRALEAQLVELGEYVKSNQVIADSTKRQADISEQAFILNSSDAETKKNAAVDARNREIKPDISVMTKSRSSDAWDIAIKNSGADAEQFSFKSDHFSAFASDLLAGGRLNRGATAYATMLEQCVNYNHRFLIIECYDVDGNRHHFSFTYDNDNGSFVKIS